MHLTVREVSKLFDVPEATVVRWIKQRGLPARHVGGQYRFQRAELLEWATLNKVKVSIELFDRESDDEPIPSIAAALETCGPFQRLAGGDKTQVLRSLVGVLPVPADVDRDVLLNLFLAREASASTAIGDGIALPHVRNPIVLHVSAPVISLCYLETPVDFGALDGKPVHVLFSLISPTMRTHLQLLARLSFALHDARFKEAILNQEPRESILREARRLEEAMVANANPLQR
jgi:PTS system nitrogen regulatory IIA component